MSCSSFQSQSDVASNVFIPAGALSTDIGLCLTDPSNERVGILMVQNNGVWGSVEVSYIISHNIKYMILLIYSKV